MRTHKGIVEKGVVCGLRKYDIIIYNLIHFQNKINATINLIFFMEMCDLKFEKFQMTNFIQGLI